MTFIAVIVLALTIFPPVLVALTVNGYVKVGPGIVDALTQGLGYVKVMKTQFLKSHDLCIIFLFFCFFPHVYVTKDFTEFTSP